MRTLIDSRSARWALAVLAIISVALFIATSVRPATLTVSLAQRSLIADGVSVAKLRVTSSRGALDATDLRATLLSSDRVGRLQSITQSGDAVELTVRTTVNPAQVEVLVKADGASPARANFETLLHSADRFGDGTPDFLRLDSESDRAAFRRWFTFLAESQFFRAKAELPEEINDCAALLRFAYREALREHAGSWQGVSGVPPHPGLGTIEKYNYPHTPLGAGFVRIKEGMFRPSDLDDGTFAQFADAETLRKLNTFFVSRSLDDAQPGDLLFYRQIEQNLPFHAMVFVGRSQVRDEGADVIAYHTGPSGDNSGEIRRVTTAALLAHPSPRWRPTVGNPNFLGVYRWNILRGTATR